MAVVVAEIGEQATDDIRRVREEIDRVDTAVVELLRERVLLARQVGEMKEAAGLPALDPAREAAVIRRCGALAREAGVPAEEVRAIFWQVVAISRQAQRERA